MILNEVGLKNLLQKLTVPNKEVVGDISNKETIRLLAKVVNVKDGKVILNSPQGQLIGKLETPVFQGERLLLEFTGIREGRFHFSILARSHNNTDLLDKNIKEQRPPLWWALLVNTGIGMPDYPVIIRYFPQGKFSQKNTYLAGNSVSILELIIETNNLGLLMIKIEFSQQQMHCSFLVETHDVGKCLEKEAIKIVQQKGDNFSTTQSLLSWKVHPVRQELIHSISEEVFIIDKKA